MVGKKQNVIAALLGSKKVIFGLTSIVAAVGTQFLGLSEESAMKFAEWIINLGMSYIGGMSVVDSSLAIRDGMRSKNGDLP